MNPEIRYMIVVKGDSWVGKSNLILRITDDCFTESYLVTNRNDFKIKIVDFSDKSIKLEIREPGPIGMRNNAPNPYRYCHGVIVVYSITDPDSFNNVKTYLREIASYTTPDAQILLLGNKSDQTTKRLVEYETAKAYANSCGLVFFETSAKNSTNVEEAMIDFVSRIYEVQKALHVEPPKSARKL